jgi:hypothetical protein
MVFSIILDARIGTKVGACLYFVTFEYEWSSYSLVWAGTKKHTNGGSSRLKTLPAHLVVCFLSPISGEGS